MKRQSATEPLTPDDVAERLNRAMLRTLQLLMDIRQTPELLGPVKASRYLTTMPHELMKELALWQA